MRHKFFLFFLVICLGSNLFFPSGAAAATKKVVKPIPPKEETKLLISAGTDFRLYPNDPLLLKFGFKNTGKIVWNNRRLLLTGPEGLSTSTPLVAAPPLKTGHLEFFTLNLIAPIEPGKYQYQVVVEANGKKVAFSNINIAVEVLPPELPASATFHQLANEPRIRVSIARPEEPVRVKLLSDYYLSVMDGSVPTTTLLGGERILWFYDTTSTLYSAEWSNGIVTSTAPLRLSPLDSLTGVIEVETIADRPSWNKSINYNQYRDSMELRWSDKNKEMRLVNELPMEFYLKGLIETGASDGLEFQKAIITAARSYAFIYLPDGVKYPNRLYDVHATNDQVYKGFVAEVKNPTGAKATDLTRGLVVTYNNQPVITPYFTRSNGMTRGWREVWGGVDKPWLQPVVAKYDKGKKLWGHGVGMSTLDARERIKKDFWTFDQVLKYFYTGVDIQQLYQ